MKYQIKTIDFSEHFITLEFNDEDSKETVITLEKYKGKWSITAKSMFIEELKELIEIIENGK